jgi:hypothetical protein
LRHGSLNSLFQVDESLPSWLDPPAMLSLSLSRSHCLTVSPSHALTVSLSHALTLSCSHALTLSRSLSLSHALTLSRSQSLSLSRSLSVCNSLTLSRSHSLTLSCSLALTRSRSHSLTLSRSHSLTDVALSPSPPIITLEVGADTHDPQKCKILIHLPRSISRWVWRDARFNASSNTSSRDKLLQGARASQP